MLFDEEEIYGTGQKMSEISPNFLRGFANFLDLWEGEFDDSSFVASILERDCLRGPWCDAIMQKRNDFMEEKKADGSGHFAPVPREYLTREDIVDAANKLREHIGDPTGRRWKSGATSEIFGDMLEFSDAEKAVLDFAIATKTEHHFYSVQTSLSRLSFNAKYKQAVKFLTIFLGYPEQEIKKALGGFLYKSGIVVPHEDLAILPQVCEDLSEILSANDFSIEMLEQKLFPNTITATLSMENFDHLSEDVLRCETMISNAMEQNVPGMNVLLWGDAGTGKTQLAFTLAKKNGWNLKVIGDAADADTTEKGRTSRLTNLKIANKLYAKRNDVVLLFDEMEDLFNKKDNAGSFSKAFVNRTIESITVPTIWTSNTIECMDQSVLRRMIYNIHFSIPPVKVREAIWNSCIEKYGISVPEEMIKGFAKTYDITPAIIDNACKIVSLSNSPSGETETIVQSLYKLINYGEEKIQNPESKDFPYDVSCINTTVDLDEFTKKLMKAKPEFSLLLYGRSGTGKSAFGKYLAEKLGKPILYTKASDLISCLIGGTEKNIAAAFRDARKNEKILLIDEGDSFLRNRESAQRSYEVTGVNEMLAQMENHNQPFILTTNLMDSMDPAAMRRFTFKMAFEFLTIEQAKRLFTQYFACEPPREIEGNDMLAPGDFACVKRRADIMGITDAGEIYEMLVEETKLKPTYRNIGFR